MKRFYVNVIDDKVKQAALIAEQLLHPNSELMEFIKTKDDFKFNSGTGKAVYASFATTKLIVPVFFYKTFNPWSGVLGYSSNKQVFLNLRKVNELQAKDLVGLLCHEYSHAIGFGHGNNYKTEDKCKYSVPYFISEEISRWL